MFYTVIIRHPVLIETQLPNTGGKAGTLTFGYSEP
jgi:hypothetical protein